MCLCMCVDFIQSKVVTTVILISIYVLKKKGFFVLSRPLGNSINYTNDEKPGNGALDLAILFMMI